MRMARPSRAAGSSRQSAHSPSFAMWREDSGIVPNGARGARALPREQARLSRPPYPIAILRGCVSGFFCTVTVRMPFSSVAASVAMSAISGRSTDAA